MTAASRHYVLAAGGAGGHLIPAFVLAEELIRRGIARQDISVTAFGETRPLVATADGAREPQNRRVEIILK